MAEQERMFTIPLRRRYSIYPRWRRVKVAVNATRSFLVKHLKTDDVKIGKYLNLALHERGRKDPPHHVQVRVTKEKDTFTAELINAPIEKPKVEEKKEKPKVQAEAKEVAPVQEKPTEVTREVIEEEKKDVLKHPDEKKTKESKPDVKRKVKGAQKRGEREHKKEVFSKTQKPAHEKKKSR